MKALLLTFYFPPDLSAGSFRAAALARALVESGFEEVHVVTTNPHRYATFRPDESKPDFEALSEKAVRVDRATVTRHKSGTIDQSLSFLTYAASALRTTRGRDYDLVIATSSRLITATLGSWIARRNRAKLLLDIRDLFVESLRDLFPNTIWSRSLVPFLSMLERSTVNRADHVNLVSAGFGPYFFEHYPGLEYTAFGNGIDTDVLIHDFTKKGNGGQPKIILYAGNIGLGQGLDRFVPDAAKRAGDEFEFRIIGDGNRARTLVRAIESRDIRNVRVIPPMSRKELLLEYSNADYLLAHLHDAPALKRVIPSKLFEYGATGKPILAGVNGEARAFVEQELENAAVFAPYDVDAFARMLRLLPSEASAREAFKRKYARDSIMSRFAQHAARLVGPPE